MHLSRVLIFCYLIISCHNANAVAWLRKKGELIYIYSLGFSEQISSNLYSYNQISAAQVQGFNYYLYAEYGLSNKITIGTNSILEFYSVVNDGNRLESGFSMKLAEYFVRRSLFKTKNQSIVLAAQILYKPPTLAISRSQNFDAIYGGLDQHDCEFMLQLLVNINPDQPFFGFNMKHKQLFNVEFGYRQRFGLEFNEARLNIQYMFWFDRNHAILLGFYKIMRIYNAQSGYPVNFLDYISWNYNDQNTGEISWVIFYKENRAISFGLFTNLYGTIFGNGDYNLGTFGFKIGFWFL